MTMQTIGPPVVPQWDIADRLRKSLRQSNIGVEQLADELGYSRQSVGNWLNGRGIPRRSVILLWAMRTGVDALWLEHGIAGDEGPNDGDDTSRGQVIDASGWFDRLAG